MLKIELFISHSVEYLNNKFNPKNKKWWVTQSKGFYSDMDFPPI